MERRVSAPSAPTIVPDVESAYLKSLWQLCRARLTRLRGTLTSTSVASAMMVTVVRTVLRRNARQELIFSVGMEARKDAIVLDVVFAIMLLVFAVASRDTLETGASTKLFSARKRSSCFIYEFCELTFNGNASLGDHLIVNQLSICVNNEV
mmetsp:Transcript_35481/g.76617  ORF Transcript_35481/g.76617 Transcript_35481/m.76617 type:complete len:151 (-) Transcript_35481:245-697(-)